ncbi:MAG: RHS repeat-associated core domain-containing protein, partial [Candidatus Eremiobacteraeota bacterium]|nr:RHS repeat-associated core domain-containing protein [Candidatus Eremiobacteraeota bacterium]
MSRQVRTASPRRFCPLREQLSNFPRPPWAHQKVYEYDDRRGERYPPGILLLVDLVALRRSRYVGAPPLNAGHSNPAQARLGRFLSRDPIGFSGGLNLYGYVGGNPVNAVDPSGLDEVYYLLTGAGPSNGYRGHSAVYVEGAGVFNFSTAGSGHDIGEGVSLDSFIDENLY